MTHAEASSEARIISNRAFFSRLEAVQLQTRSVPTPDEIDCVSPSVILPRPEEHSQQHWEVIERILFVYSKLNPAVGYVQGMNEMLCPIYFVLAHDGDEDSKSNEILNN